MLTREEQVGKTIVYMSDKQFERLVKAYVDYRYGNAPKSRLNYWLKKYSITLEEYEQWALG